MFESLTPREREVLQLMAAGKSTKEIAANLSIAFKTAACHRANVLAKLGTTRVVDTIRCAFQRGLVNLLSDGSEKRPEAAEALPNRILNIREESL